MTKAQQKAKLIKAIKAIESTFNSEIMGNYKDFFVEMVYFSDTLQTVEITTPEYEENYMISNGSPIAMNHDGYTMHQEAKYHKFVTGDFKRNIKYSVKSTPSETDREPDTRMIEERAQELAAQMLKRFATSM